MNIIRAMPKVIPENRNYVVDSIDRVAIYNYDMHFLIDIDDDVILLEWDIAIAHHDLNNFVAHARDMPNRLQVAPYILYNSSMDELTAPVWAHRHMVNELPLQLSWIDYGDPVCDLFSTGMIYIPKEIIKRLGEADDLVTWHNNLNDSKFAFWHYYEIGEKVPVHWDCRPIHLHYPQEAIYDEPGISHYVDPIYNGAMS